MSISFKEFSDILEKKSGTFGAKSKKATYGKDTSLSMKSTTAKAPGGGGKSKEGKLGGGLTFGGGKKGKKPVVKKPEKKFEPEKKSEPEKPKQARFGGIGLVDRKKDTEQRAAQEKLRKAGIDRAKKEREDKKKQDRIDQNKAEIDKENKAGEASDKRIEKNKKAIEKEKKDKAMNTESTIKEDWIEDKIIYKLLDRNEKRAAATFKAMNKSQKMKFVDAVQTITSKNYGYTDAEVEDALLDYNIDITKSARKKWEEVENQQEAENMHKYVNTLSLERSVNLWAEAAKKDEDLDPVKGDKTLTKKSQEKITINPMEKQPSRGV